VLRKYHWSQLHSKQILEKIEVFKVFKYRQLFLNLTVTSIVDL